MHRAATHQLAELGRLEEETHLSFAGFVHVDCLVPVFVRSDRPQAERRAIIRRLNDKSSPGPARRRAAA